MVLEHFRVCVLVSKYMMVVGKKKKGGRTEYRAFVGLCCILGRGDLPRRQIFGIHYFRTDLNVAAP